MLSVVGLMAACGVGWWWMLRWMNDLWVTDTICTAENLDQYAIVDCSMRKY